jgi:hypothetical protein
MPEAERRGQASHFQRVRLTGADVAWLAKQVERGAFTLGVLTLHPEGEYLELLHLETLRHMESFG